MIPSIYLFSTIAAAITYSLNGIRLDVAMALLMVSVHYAPPDKATLPASVVRVVWLCIPVPWPWLRYWILWLIFLGTNARKGQIAYDIFMFSLWVPIVGGLYCLAPIIGTWFVPMVWFVYQVMHWCSVRKTAHSIGVMRQLTSFAVFAFAMGRVALVDTALTALVEMGIQWAVFTVRKDSAQCHHWAEVIGLICLFAVFSGDSLALVKYTMVFVSEDLMMGVIVGVNQDIPEDYKKSLFFSTLMYISCSQLVRLYR